ncbi:MAG: D-ribose pyranase [Spirochaetales bacterium]|nr:D-ribose pyranase [Spirochaetales bacterium]
MKKQGLLNSGLLRALGNLTHGDIVVISDAGMPVPEGAEKIDLAIVPDYPEITQVLKAFLEEFIYEKVVVASEQKENNPLLYSKVNSIIKRCPITLAPHSEFLEDMVSRAKYVIRTGSFEPWGNILLVSGIDAPLWFAKEGVKVPEEYEERVKVSL